MDSPFISFFCLALTLFYCALSLFRLLRPFFALKVMGLGDEFEQLCLAHPTISKSDMLHRANVDRTVMLLIKGALPQSERRFLNNFRKALALFAASLLLTVFTLLSQTQTDTLTDLCISLVMISAGTVIAAIASWRARLIVVDLRQAQTR